MQEPQALPARFPCWVRAKFSYGGESKHDLGFIEGDLIECLNAGDGSWWMGRLWRDRRVKGLFPSNFVEVLDINFRPAVRSSSPLPRRSPSTSPFNPQPPQNARTKLSRKPFQSYSAPSPVSTKRIELQKQEATPSPAPNIRDKQPKVQTQIRKFESRAPPTLSSPFRAGYGSNSYNCNYQVENKYNYGSHISCVPNSEPVIISNIPSRATSPIPPYNSNHLRGALPVSEGVKPSYVCRTPSPHTSIQHEYDINRPTNIVSQLESSPSSLPPAPPPHRIVYKSLATENSHNFQRNSESKSQAPSPSPPSSRETGLTPSPLRTAMDDVISSLAVMGLSHNETYVESPTDPWSPEDFDQTYSRAWGNNGLDLNFSEKYGLEQQPLNEKTENSFDRPPTSRIDPNPPLLSNYVQRMESRLSRMHNNSPRLPEDDQRPAVLTKMDLFERPKSSLDGRQIEPPKLLHRRSAYDIGKSMIGRTFTTKTNLTNSSSGTQSTTTNATSSTDYSNRSLMSGPSASGLSHTSAGSLERKRGAAFGRSLSAYGTRREQFTGENYNLREPDAMRSETPLTGVSFHSSHASDHKKPQSQVIKNGSSQMGTNALGGLMAPKPKKSGFFKKMIETAKTGAASARNSTIISDLIKPAAASKLANGVTSIAGGLESNTNNKSNIENQNIETDWVQVRRDVNRSNSLSKIERMDRRERCQMMDYLTINPVDELYENFNGDEGADGHPIGEATNFQPVNYSLVDKNTRFVNSLPPMTNPISLATGFICRPYRSDVQRLRAIFTWTSEKIAWEEDFESEIDSRRVIQSKRGCAQEVAILVMEMCNAVGIHAEVIHGYLKIPGDYPEPNVLPRPNHWWNAVIVDGEWRIMDCSLAAPSHPRRSLFSSTNCQVAESWWFLARPIEMCWTHIPQQYEQQHICPPVSPQILLSLPCTCPPFFKHEIKMTEYETSLVRIEDLELAHIKFTVPADVECVAEVEAKTIARDIDGDPFETGDVIKKRALAQAEWVGGQKRYTVKALLPGDEGYGVLKIYAGKRGLMHSIKDIPHPLAFSLPIIHTGENPPYEFFTQHPTPHAQRHDLYVAQPQCKRLALNNTFVFAIRQHPSSLGVAASSISGGNSLISTLRPSSAISMSSSSAISSHSGNNPYTSIKPAKLAIQSPSGKVLRLMRKEERNPIASQDLTDKSDGGTWETIIKIGEKGLWRGLVLADRMARWCVFAEWTCD